MKWISHKLLTGSIVYALSENPIITLASIAGSIIPDAVEGFPSEENYALWRKNHRRFSHWIFPYLAIFVTCNIYSFMHGTVNVTLFTLLNNPDMNFSLVTYLIAWICIGACFHILQDAVCGKVPLLHPGKQEFGIKLFNVGSFKEYIIVLSLSALLLLTKL